VQSLRRPNSWCEEQIARFASRSLRTCFRPDPLEDDPPLFVEKRKSGRRNLILSPGAGSAPVRQAESRIVKRSAGSPYFRGSSGRQANLRNQKEQL